MGGDKGAALPGKVSFIISVFLDERCNIGFRGKTNWGSEKGDLPP